MIKIKRAIELGDKANQILSKIFVDSYYDELKEISKDRKKLYRAFEHTFLLGYTYIAFINNEAVGFISCTNGCNRSMLIDSKVFRKEFGFIKGSIISKILISNFTKEPLKSGYKIGFIDNVATSPSSQGNGVGTALIKHVLNFSRYNHYVLEVSDNNSSAIHLYSKLGFTEFDRVKFKHTKKHSINHLLWLEHKVYKI